MQCLILAGGLGTRMRGFDPTTPKALLPVAGMPFAHWQLSWLSSEGVNSVVYSLGHMGEMIKEYVKDGSRWGISVRYVEETDGLLGTGGAVRLAVDEGDVDNQFFVLYGDSYLQVSLRELHSNFGQRHVPAIMTVYENDDRWDTSNVIFENEMVTRYEKGCVSPPLAMRYIDYGLSEVRTEAVQELIAPNCRSDLAEFYAELSRQGRLGGFEAKERFYEVGSTEGLHELDLFLKGGIDDRGDDN